MKTHDHSQDQDLRRWILQWCDDTISDEDTLRLESALTGSPDARQLFAELTLVNSALESLGPAGTSIELDLPPRAQGRFFRRAWQIMALAASVILLGAVTVWILRSADRAGAASPALALPAEPEDELPAVAIVTHSLQTAFGDGADDRLPAGALVAPRRVQLKEGLLQLQFFNGVKLVIEGPADFEILSLEESRCHSGRFHANVPQHAQGFIVHTPSGELVDFGTEFGLHVRPDGASEIHVFEGEVAFRNDQEETVAQLSRGEAASIGRDGSTLDGEADADLFASHREVNEWYAMSVEKRFAQWYHASRQWRTHPDLLAYFDFDSVDYLTGIIPALSSNPYQGDLECVFVGARGCSGRWPGKAAFDFTRRSDRIRARIPGYHDALSLAVWARIDRLDKRRHGLLMSDGMDHGGVHWFIDGASRTLALETSVSEDSDPVRYDSPPILTDNYAGQWILLGCVYDRFAGIVTHFVNGSSVGQNPLQDDLRLRTGVADLGNWTPSNRAPSPIPHHFDGVIDEFMVFGTALSPEVMAQIARTGMPESM